MQIVTVVEANANWRDIDEEAALAGMLGISESALEEAAGFTIHRLARFQGLICQR